MKCVNQKSSNKNNIFGNEETSEELVWKKDSYPGKLNDIMDNLNNIFKDKNLKELGKVTDSQEISQLANMLYTEMEIFISTH